MKEYQSNSHAGFYTKWIFIFIYYLSWPGAGSQSQNFDIPAPARSFGPLRLRLHNTAIHKCFFHMIKTFTKQRLDGN